LREQKGNPADSGALGAPGRAPWERDEEEAYLSPTITRPENQLGTGVPLRTPMTQTRRAPEPVFKVLGQMITTGTTTASTSASTPAAVGIQEEVEEENWSEATAQDRYPEPRRYAEVNLQTEGIRGGVKRLRTRG